MSSSDLSAFGGLIGGGLMGAAAVWKTFERIWPAKPRPPSAETLSALTNQTELTEQVVKLLRKQSELTQRALDVTERQNELTKESVGLLRELHAETKANVVRLDSLAKAIDRATAAGGKP